MDGWGQITEVLNVEQKQDPGIITAFCPDEAQSSNVQVVFCEVSWKPESHLDY